MDVLFLTVSTGEGHVKAAEAIKDCVARRFPGSRTLILDVLKYIHPLLDGVVAGGYLQAIRRAPGLYGRMYQFSEKNGLITGIAKAVNGLLSNKLIGIITEFNPSVIVCAHTLPLHMISSLKCRGFLDIPVAAVVTDFASHPFWKLDGADAFTVAHEHIKQDMIRQGIPAQKIYPYGIPVSTAFLHRKNRQEILGELGLENKPTFLVTGGSLGYGNIPAAFRMLAESKEDLQMIVVTGRNQRLKERLERDFSNRVKNTVILGYTNRMSELMDASDFLLTKPGGITASEALLKQLPILIMSPIPGQEERNTQFLVSSGAAVLIHPHTNIDRVFHQVIGNPLRVKQMKEAARTLAKPRACEDIVSLLGRLTDSYEMPDSKVAFEVNEAL